MTGRANSLTVDLAEGLRAADINHLTNAIVMLGGVAGVPLAPTRSTAKHMLLRHVFEGIARQVVRSH